MALPPPDSAVPVPGTFSAPEDAPLPLYQEDAQPFCPSIPSAKQVGQMLSPITWGLKG